MSMPPWPVKAWVISQDPDHEAVMVSLGGPMGGQGPTLACQVLSHGPRDGVVGRFPALPTAGTHGVVVFPSGDGRSGVWLGAVSTQLTDASTHAPGNGAADYAAHYGGGWSYRSQNGDVTEVFPDGTMLQVGPTVPAPTRHTIDAQQARQRTAFTATQRRPQTPGAFPLTLTHPTGASVAVTASGAVTVVAAASQAVTLIANGSSVIIDASGNVVITAPLVTVSGNLQVAGLVVAGAGGADQVSLQTHRHGLGTSAAGTVVPTPGT